MKLIYPKQKTSSNLRIFFVFAAYLITTNLYSQIKPYIAIGVANDCHEYFGNTGYLQWNGMPIYDNGKKNILGTSLTLGAVLFDKFIIGYTHSKSNTDGENGLTHYRSTRNASGISVIPIIARTNKLKVGIGLNASIQKSSIIYSDDMNSYGGEYWGNLISLSTPLWIDFQVSEKISILCLPSYGICESYYYTVLPIWNINVGMVYNMGSENITSTSKKIKTY